MFLAIMYAEVGDEARENEERTEREWREKFLRNRRQKKYIKISIQVFIYGRFVKNMIFYGLSTRDL
jgi:hypothetical protein